MDKSAPRAHYARFKDFYPYYLQEHRHPTCRRLHFVGTSIVILVLIAAAVSRRPILLLAAPLAGYGFAWIGHFVFEKNKPATFSHPWYSLLGDFAMWRDVLLGRLKF